MKTSSNNETIKEKAKLLFYQYGLKSVSVDDIAKLSGISKKTVYQFYDDKNAIIDSVVNDLLGLHEQLFKTSRVIANDAIDEVLKQDIGLSQIWRSLRPSFFFELEKYFPEIWKEVEQYKLNVQHDIISNLRWGKEDGLYHEDLNLSLLSDLRVQQLINVLQPKVLTSLDLNSKQLAGEFTMLFLRSIVTPKGKDLLDKYMKEKKIDK